MKRTRKNHVQENFPLRVLIESEVTALNRFMKPLVRFMSLHDLVVNVHPAYRYDYACKLKKEGRVSEKFIKEFKTRESFEL